MPNQKTTINDLLHELQQTIDARGAAATIALLRNARETVSENTHLQFVVVSVCNQLSISIDQMMKGKDDTAKYAKGYIVYYLRNDFEIDWPEIKSLLHISSQSWLWETMKLIKDLKPRLAAHANWVEFKKDLDKQIKNYKTQIK